MVAVTVRLVDLAAEVPAPGLPVAEGVIPEELVNIPSAKVMKKPLVVVVAPIIRVPIKTILLVRTKDTALL